MSSDLMWAHSSRSDAVIDVSLSFAQTLPKSSMASLVRALKPGGRVIVVDFIRIEGVSREWILGHVRAGEEVFRREIEEAGLRFDAKLELPGLEENYNCSFD